MFERKRIYEYVTDRGFAINASTAAEAKEIAVRDGKGEVVGLAPTSDDWLDWGMYGVPPEDIVRHAAAQLAKVRRALAFATGKDIANYETAVTKAEETVASAKVKWMLCLNNQLLPINAPTSKQKLLCTECDWHGYEHQTLRAPHPFVDNWVLRFCPSCYSVEKFVPACSDPECRKPATCGFNTKDGYRLTCGQHYVDEDNNVLAYNAALDALTLG